MNRQARVYELPSGKWSARVDYSLPDTHAGRAYTEFLRGAWGEVVAELEAIVARKGHAYDVTKYELVAGHPFTLHPPEGLPSG